MTRPQHNFGYAYEQMTVATILADKAKRNGDRRFLTYLTDGRSFSYAELDAITNRYANGLIALGIGHGAHVAVWMVNSPEMIFSIFALGKIGAVAVPMNTAIRGQLLSYYLTHADISAIIAGGLRWRDSGGAAADRPWRAGDESALRPRGDNGAVHRGARIARGAGHRGQALRSGLSDVHIRHHRPVQGQYAGAIHGMVVGHEHGQQLWLSLG